MATSGSTDFTVFRDAIIKGALRKIGRLGAGEDIDPTEIQDLAETLNQVVLDLQNDQVYLWALREASFSLVEADRDYSLPDDVLDVAPRETYVRNTDETSDTLLHELSRKEYLALASKADTTGTQGVPVQYYIDKVRTATSGSHEYGGLLTMYVYPTPDATAAADYTLHYTAIRKLEDLDAPGDDVDWPVRWLRPLTLYLAADISNDYGLALEQRRHLMQLAEERRRAASRADTQRGGFRISPRMRW